MNMEDILVAKGKDDELPDGRRQYICWTGKITTEKQAMDVAKGWAVRTDVYIDTGVWKR